MGLKTVVNNATATGTFTFETDSKSNTASVNVLFTASSPGATVEIQERNEPADGDGVTDPWVPVSGASYTASTSDGLTGLTKGQYRVEITGTVNDSIYVTVSE